MDTRKRDMDNKHHNNNETAGLDRPEPTSFDWDSEQPQKKNGQIHVTERRGGKPNPGGLKEHTQADPDWRRRQGGGLREHTEADPDWRKKQGGGLREHTEADPDWRKKQNGGLQEHTQADPGWQRTPGSSSSGSQPGTAPGSGSGMEDIMNRATGSRTATLDEFKDSAGNIPCLISATRQKYPVKGVLSRKGGESLVLLCSAPNGKDVAAKVYYKSVNSYGSTSAARAQVLRYMATEDGKKYTLAVSDIGLVNIGSDCHYFEIIPYCPDGDLNDGTVFSFDQMVALTRHLNEALHSMHEAGILHRDLKPANLYRLEGRIVIGDFGVAKQASAGMTEVTVGTDGYRAPETMFAVSTTQSAVFYDARCDYYSLGITLGSLFQGHFVYKDMAVGMVTVAVQQSKVPLTRQDPNRSLMENLVNGLCRFDPNHRFGYEDVCKWLADPHYTGGIADDTWQKSFRLGGKEFRDEKSLFEGITADAGSWNEAREMLYRKYFEQFFMSFRTDLARAAQDADDTWRTADRDKGLAIFLKTLYSPGPIVWKGYTFRSLQELADRMVVAKTPAAYGEILAKKVISHWLEHTSGIKVDPGTVRLVKSMENLALKEPEIACYWFGNSFAAVKGVTVCGKTVRDLPQLLGALFQSSRSFYLGGGYDMVMDRAAGAGLYGFLYALGFGTVIDEYWAKTRGCDEFQKACLLFGMLDTIAEKGKTDPAPVRRFFLSYGPVGIATYTRRILAQKGDGLYEPMDASGKQILEKITSFRASNPGNVDKLYQDMIPLMELIAQMQKQLVDNPFCIRTGTYEKKGILCRNLEGCFGFRIFGRMAPLGFHAWLEGNGEGVKK